MVSQTSVAARRGRILWDDLQGERRYDAMALYRQSKIACGLFALELGRRSAAGGWGVTSALSHPGVAPTNLLAAQPGTGRTEDGLEIRTIRWLSARGILIGTPQSAALPALMALTAREDHVGHLFGPRGPGQTGGRPGTHALWKPLRDEAEAARVWDWSAEAAGVTWP